MQHVQLTQHMWQQQNGGKNTGQELQLMFTSKIRSDEKVISLTFIMA